MDIELQNIWGGWLSTTVRANWQLVLPQSLVAVTVTFVVPRLKVLPLPVPLPVPVVAPLKL
jgi:hypothetical protein